MTTAKRILVTGAAGFIGFHLARRLCTDGHVVHGLDNLNDYYDVSLKQARLDHLTPHKNFTFTRADLADQAAVTKIFTTFKPQIVINLAAQAGVRGLIDQPHKYLDANITGFMNVLESCRHHPVEHLIYASSSSVYGANTKVPFSEDDAVNHPVSMYAATKRANELMAETYAHLFKIPSTGLRFFTVYGPWGRPDMAYFKFMAAMSAGQPIDVFNNGQMRRDFTYIDDIVEGIVRLIPHVPATNPTSHTVYNIGNHQPVALLDMIKILEEESGLQAHINMRPMHLGDVIETYADISKLKAAVGFSPATPLRDGLKKFVAWYQGYTKP